MASGRERRTFFLLEPLSSGDFLPATDPEGFDRELFHQKLPTEIREHLDNTLMRS